MTFNLLLSADEIRLIVSALAVVSPTGGGSPTYTLQRLLTSVTDISPDDELVARYCQNVIDDYEESKS